MSKMTVLQDATSDTLFAPAINTVTVLHDIVGDEVISTLTSAANFTAQMVIAGGAAEQDGSALLTMSAGYGMLLKGAFLNAVILNLSKISTTNGFIGLGSVAAAAAAADLTNLATDDNGAIQIDLLGAFAVGNNTFTGRQPGDGTAPIQTAGSVFVNTAATYGAGAGTIDCTTGVIELHWTCIR
jgi:hypothetical protein